MRWRSCSSGGRLSLSRRSGWPTSTIWISFDFSVSRFDSIRISSSAGRPRFCASSITSSTSRPAARSSTSRVARSRSSAGLLVPDGAMPRSMAIASSSSRGSSSVFIRRTTVVCAVEAAQQRLQQRRLARADLAGDDARSRPGSRCRSAGSRAPRGAPGSGRGSRGPGSARTAARAAERSAHTWPVCGLHSASRIVRERRRQRVRRAGIGVARAPRPGAGPRAPPARSPRGSRSRSTGSRGCRSRAAGERRANAWKARGAHSRRPPAATISSTAATSRLRAGGAELRDAHVLAVGVRRRAASWRCPRRSPPRTLTFISSSPNGSRRAVAELHEQRVLVARRQQVAEQLRVEEHVGVQHDEAVAPAGRAPATASRGCWSRRSRGFSMIAGRRCRRRRRPGRPDSRPPR